MKNIVDLGVNAKCKTFVIAEIGINHGGSVEVAKELIDSCAKTGANAVKFQTYITESRAPIGSPIFDILKKCELPLDAFEELKIHSESRGLLFFSTPFDLQSLAYLEEIGCPLYKIASFDVTNKPFIKMIAATKKPIIMSVGMSTLSEIEAAVDSISKYNKNNLALLHCISAYPTKEEDTNLNSIGLLRDTFSEHVIGYSDHTNGIKVPLYAVAAGAKIIEKHYKIDSNMNCVDAPVSITECQMTEMVKEIRRIENILGSYEVGISNVQKELLWLKRTAM